MEERALKLLSLDGGGIRGLSTLHVLQKILWSIKAKLNLREVPLPCEYFDLIGGTSTGGLIALMLGRLRMPIEDAIEAYAKLSEYIFSHKKYFGDGKYSATRLEAAVRKIVEEHAGDAGFGIFDPRIGDNHCRTFVCAVPAKNMSGRIPSLIRSYEAPGQLPIPCTIIEAARATTAAPTFFKRAIIKVQGIKREYIDGGVAQNNPCVVVLKEAELVFPGRNIACIISIGTGKLPIIRLKKQGVIGNLIPLKVAKALTKIATDTENTHQDLQFRFKSRPNVYFRFNVDEGMQDVTLDEWNKLDDVMSHAEKYMENEDVRQKLEGSVKVLVEQKGALGVSEAIGNVPAAVKLDRLIALRKYCPPPSRVFTGRADILSVVHKHFSSDSTNEQLMFVLYGLGGSGKSEIMRRFVADSQVQTEDHPRRFSEVLYVDASSAATLEVDLANISIDKKLGERAKDTVNWLVRTRDEAWLLVLDNADDAALNLKPFIPQCSHGNIIITTRNRQLEIYDKSFEVSRMSEEDAKDLFVRRSLIANSQDPKMDMLVTQIVKELDFLALGIIQAAAYLQVNKTCTLERYISILLSDRRDILEEYKYFIHKPDDYEKTVYTTWNISLERLQHTHPEAVKFLFVCSFLHHKNISQAMFINAASSAPDFTPQLPTLSDAMVSWDQAFLRPFIDPTALTSKIYHRVVAALSSYSLMEVTPEGNLSIHRLVQDWSRHHARAVEIYPIYSALILHLSCEHFFDLKTPDALAYTRMLLPHMQELQTSLDSDLDVNMAYEFQVVYHHHGWWEPAERLGKWVTEECEKICGKEHPNTLARMGDLAVIYSSQGRWREAEELEVTVMETRKRVLGEEHPDTLTSMANLASTIREQGRWTEAEEMDVMVLEVRMRVLGMKHPDTLASMADLALMYMKQGRWAEAEQLEVMIIEMRKWVLGKEHPDTLSSMGNLASTYANQGRWREAEEVQVALVETSKRILGEEHPNTLMDMANLALTYSNQGRLTEAEELNVTVMETRKRVLGERHPDTLTSIGNLASTYWRQGRLAKAEELEVTVMETRSRVLGEAHPDTLQSIANLAMTYRSQGRLEEAEKIERTGQETGLLDEDHGTGVIR